MAKQFYKVEIPRVFPDVTDKENATLVYKMIADCNGYNDTITKTVEHSGTYAEFETAMENDEVVQLSHDEDADVVVWTTYVEITNPTTKEQHGKNVLARPMLDIFKRALITMKTKQIEDSIKQAKDMQKATINAVEQAVEQAISGIEPK